MSSSDSIRSSGLIDIKKGSASSISVSVGDSFGSGSDLQFTCGNSASGGSVSTSGGSGIEGRGGNVIILSGLSIDFFFFSINLLN
jgi:hypothetical protein